MNQQLKKLQEERKLLQDEAHIKAEIEKEKQKIKDLKPKGLLTSAYDMIERFIKKLN